MVRLILNWKGVDLVTRELVDDFVTIGRAPLNQILIDHPTSINAARRAYESRRLLLAKGFEFNERNTDQWRPCH